MLEYTLFYCSAHIDYVQPYLAQSYFKEHSQDKKALKSCSDRHICSQFVPSSISVTLFVRSVVFTGSRDFEFDGQGHLIEPVICCTSCRHKP